MFKNTMIKILQDCNYQPTLQDILCSLGIVAIVILTAILEGGVIV